MNTRQHRGAVEALQRAYATIPPGAPVRLAKSTSNLFRFSPGGSSSGGAGLDVSAFGTVLGVDPVARTADVGGMVTYEHLVDATLPHGLMPTVVPQLKTITLGGAVAGLGIESSSWRHGLPHESVLELEILTGDGRVVLARPDNEHADLFHAFPNSYGSLGYALRLVIRLVPTRPLVALRHVRFDTAPELLTALERACDPTSAEADFVDATVFGPDEGYLTLGTFTDTASSEPSDYTGMSIYYRSIAARPTDVLTVRDYLWRWDTDWFWCSRALGVQHPVVRRLWPRRWRRSDVYRRLVALDRRHGLSATALRLLGKPAQEPVVQDVELPLEQTAKFLEVFHREVGIAPIWLCPLRSHSAWPLYPLAPGELYVNAGFWSSAPLLPGMAPDHHNRLVEETVAALGGHKSLYSTVHYSEAEFWQHYNGPAYRAVKRAYDPAGRLPDLFDKVSVIR